MDFVLYMHTLGWELADGEEEEPNTTYQARFGVYIGGALVFRGQVEYKIRCGNSSSTWFIFAKFTLVTLCIAVVVGVVPRWCL